MNFKEGGCGRAPRAENITTENYTGLSLNQLFRFRTFDRLPNTHLSVSFFHDLRLRLDGSLAGDCGPPPAGASRLTP
jgi:hypothetical protein